MRTIQIDLTEETVSRLEELANKRGLSSEDFLRWVTEKTVHHPDENFDKVVRHVLEKNEELYRRLAT